jgi:general secretion pathway protein K
MNRTLHRGQRGAALLIALVAVALASVLALGLIERGQSGLARTQALVASERSYQLARGMELLAEDLIEQALSQGLAPPGSERWTPPYEVPGGRIQGRLQDLNGRFNLNALAHPDPAVAERAQAAFERLLDHLGLNRLIAAELADWIEGGGVPRPGSAAEAWYTARQPPYRMAGTRLAHVTELRWLRSVDEDAWARLEPHVAALPEPELRINVNATSAAVLASLDHELGLDQARRILADGPFRDVAGFMAHPLVAARPRPELAGLLAVNGLWYQAQARVVLDGVERDYFSLIRHGASGYDFRLFSQGVH